MSDDFHLQRYRPRGIFPMQYTIILSFFFLFSKTVNITTETCDSYTRKLQMNESILNNGTDEKGLIWILLKRNITDSFNEPEKYMGQELELVSEEEEPVYPVFR